MAGVKGRSGRRPKSYERHTISHVVNESVHLCYMFITDPTQPIDKRVDIASRFAVKHMPQNIISKSLSMNLTDETAKRLIEVLDRSNQRKKMPLNEIPPNSQELLEEPVVVNKEEKKEKNKNNPIIHSLSLNSIHPSMQSIPLVNDLQCRKEVFDSSNIESQDIDLNVSREKKS